MARAWMHPVGRVGSTILAAYALGALTGGGELALAIGGAITVVLFEVRTLHLGRKQMLSERHPSLDAAPVDAAPVDASPVGDPTLPDGRLPSVRRPDARLRDG